MKLMEFKHTELNQIPKSAIQTLNWQRDLRKRETQVGAADLQASSA